MNDIVRCSSNWSITRINWHVTDWCNYNCSYCHAANTLTNNFRVEAHSTEYKMVLARLKLLDKPFEVCLVGGEPTLHPNIHEILTELTSMTNMHRVWFFTNLSRSIKFLKSITEINNEKLTMYASYHPEYHNDKFIEKCLELKCSVHISLVSDEQYWPRTIELIEILKNHNIEYKLNLLEPTSSWIPDYNDKFKETFKPYIDMTEDVLDMTIEYQDGTVKQCSDLSLEVEGLDNFKGYRCTPESFQVRLDGSFTNVCTNKVMPLSLRSVNIIEEITCPHEKCVRGLLMYTKTK